MYKVLTELGSHYQGEHARAVEIEIREAELAGCLAASDAHRAAQKGGPAVATHLPAGRKRIEALARFHEQQARNTIQGDVLAGNIIDIRRWLLRNGAWADRNGKIRWWRNTVPTAFHDIDIPKQELTRLTLRDGLLRGADGKPFSTKEMTTHFSGKGHAIYVMSEEGHLHASTHLKGYRHHSSLLAGRQVACAGEMRVHEGRLEWISNKSGHYRPEPIHMIAVLHRLNKLGVPLTFLISILNPDGSDTEYPNIHAFMDDLRLDDESFNLREVQWSYRHHSDGEILRATGMAFILSGSSPPGVYDVFSVPMQKLTLVEFENRMREAGFHPDYVKSGAGR